MRPEGAPASRKSTGSLVEVTYLWCPESHEDWEVPADEEGQKKLVQHLMRAHKYTKAEAAWAVVREGKQLGRRMSWARRLYNKEASH